MGICFNGLFIYTNNGIKKSVNSWRGRWRERQNTVQDMGWPWRCFFDFRGASFSEFPFRLRVCRPGEPKIVAMLDAISLLVAATSCKPITWKSSIGASCNVAFHCYVYIGSYTGMWCSAGNPKTKSTFWDSSGLPRFPFSVLLLWENRWKRSHLMVGIWQDWTHTWQLFCAGRHPILRLVPSICQHVFGCPRHASNASNFGWWFPLALSWPNPQKHHVNLTMIA
jgi:hypothetical protein